MIGVSDLKAVARARLKDAQLLLRESRFDGAAYLAGYAVEIALKARICQTLGWAGFPETRREFEGYASFRTHDLAVLLHLSGREASLAGRHRAQWGIIVMWTPEERYNLIGSISEVDARDRVAATRFLVALILRRL